MSDIGSGQYASYTPPPPPPSSSKLPWLYLAVGCGVMIVLGFAGCVTVGVVFSKKMQQSMKAPLNTAEISRILGDTPRYPGAVLDTNLTKAMRMPISMYNMVYGAKESGGAAYRTKDSFQTVMLWYDSKLQTSGFMPGKSQSQLFSFHKGDEVVSLQDLSARTHTPGTEFLLMRFHGAARPSGGQ